MADELFNQADTNKDQRLDLNEFRQLIARNLGFGSTNYGANAHSGGQYTTSSYESLPSAICSDVNIANSNYGAGAELIGTNINGIGTAGGESSYGSYGQSSYTSASGLDASGFDATALSGAGSYGFNANVSSGLGFGGFTASSSSDVGFSSETAGFSMPSTFETSTSQQQFQLGTGNTQGVYQDPNPQIIRRPAPGGGVTYTQNIRIRFLQPPPVPPPGPLIIKEVRPPQPPPPPPLRICQRAPPLPPPPPLVLRERPPVPPAPIASQTVIRRLPAVPVPPRSIIVERLPPLPPRPRDIIIERWIPYGAQAKRKTIVQRAAAAKEYPKPRNMIIQYEPAQVRVIRQFHRLGITQENPQLYVQRYGASLLDAHSLIQQARTAGVIEDISPPSNLATSGASLTSFNAGSGIETIGGGFGASASSFESFGYSGGSQQGGANLSGFESTQGVGVTQDFSSSLSSYETGSAAFQGGNMAFGGTGVSGYESYNASSGAIPINSMNEVAAAFQAADINKDGTLDVNEFRQFLSSHLVH
ncbi:unnamed protein product [Rotaria sordida]|uniref:EF-hand domain-containing protein n=1 Tax=Rotaria sordida TaxID=392033 RepID=A0A819C8A5_9BILA|nr:unnamed protein product [Rotaria sordida]CAF3816480.1 unnamed protein product [Rotaria sordida]